MPMKAKKSDPNWIEKLHKGALHKSLNVPTDKKIPAKKMAKAAKSSNPKMRKEVIAARTLSGLRK